jgi:hypothetical protein
MGWASASAPVDSRRPWCYSAGSFERECSHRWPRGHEGASQEATVQRWQVAGVIGLALGTGLVGGIVVNRLMHPSAPVPGSYVYPNSRTPPISLPPSAAGQQEYEQQRAP